MNFILNELSMENVRIGEWPIVKEKIRCGDTGGRCTLERRGCDFDVEDQRSNLGQHSDNISVDSLCLGHC